MNPTIEQALALAYQRILNGTRANALAHTTPNISAESWFRWLQADVATWVSK